MNKEILRLAIPNIIANVTVPLLSMVDLALVGHLGSEIYIGAIALGTVIFNFIYWGFSFLRMSTSGFTAQAYGEKDEKETGALLYRTVLTAFILGFLILVFQVPIEWLSFKVINGSEEVERLAQSYFSIRIWAAPATLGLYAINGWLLGMQNARYPMIVSILVNVLNIAMSFFFVYFLEMKSDGAALGTLIAQYIGILIAIIMILKRYRQLLDEVGLDLILNLSSLKSIFKVNSDIFIRTFCVILVFTFFTSKSASVNDSVLAINSLLIQFLLLFAFFIDGFAFAGEAIVGKFIGMKDKFSLITSVRLLFYWGSGLAIAYSIIYLVTNSIILKFLTDDQELINQSREYIWWIVVLPLLSFSSFIWDGIFIGATASKAMRNTMIAATFLIFLPVYYFFKANLNNHALWLAMSLFMLSRGVFQSFLYRKHILKSIR